MSVTKRKKANQDTSYFYFNRKIPFLNILLSWDVKYAYELLPNISAVSLSSFVTNLDCNLIQLWRRPNTNSSRMCSFHFPCFQFCHWSSRFAFMYFFLSYKNVYFSCSGWIFIFFFRLKAENIVLVYILRLPSIILVF